MKLFQRRKWCILDSWVDENNYVRFREEYVYIPLWHRHNWVKWADPYRVWDCSKCGWRKGAHDDKHEIGSWPRQWMQAACNSAWIQVFPSLWFWLRNVRCFHKWGSLESLFYFGGVQRQCQKCERWMYASMRAQWTWEKRWWHSFMQNTRWHYGYINDAGW